MQRQLSTEAKRMTDAGTTTRSFPSLPKHFCRRQSNRICFVTSEFHGLFKNGGIGTANTGLAMALAENGVEVSVLYTDCNEAGPRTQSESFEDVRKRYHELGITLEFVSTSPRLWDSFNDKRG